MSSSNVFATTYFGGMNCSLGKHGKKCPTVENWVIAAYTLGHIRDRVQPHLSLYRWEAFSLLQEMRTALSLAIISSIVAKIRR